MPPTNTSFATATLISTFPYDATQSDINDAGVNYTVYYKFTAPALARVIGAWGFSGNIGSGYRPTIRPYIGPAGAPTQILGIAAQNIPIQFPVDVASEYFLEFTKNLDDAGPNSLRVRCEVAPLDEPEHGDILVNDDTEGFPMWVGSPDVDNETENFIKNIAAGEAGDIIPTGILCLEDNSDNSVKLYDANDDFSQVDTTTAFAGTIRIRSNADRDLFYIGHYNAGQAYYRTITSEGVESGDVTLTALATIGTICADVGDLILYIGEFGVAGAIRRWDIVNGVFLSDLVAGVAGYRIPDILVLSDGAIVVLYHQLVTQDVFLRIYNAAGATVNTWSLGIQAGTVMPRMAWALDNPNSVWVMTHGGGSSIFTNIKISDGSTLGDKTEQEYETGVYNNSETASPVTRFGNSFSCPFMILSLPDPPGIFIITTDKRTDSDGFDNVKIPNPTFKTSLMP